MPDLNTALAAFHAMRIANRHTSWQLGVAPHPQDYRYPTVVASLGNSKTMAIVFPNGSLSTWAPFDPPRKIQKRAARLARQVVR